MNIRYPIYEGVYRILTNVREAGGTGCLTKQSRQVCCGKRVQRGPRETGKDGKTA